MDPLRDRADLYTGRLSQLAQLGLLRRDAMIRKVVASPLVVLPKTQRRWQRALVRNGFAYLVLSICGLSFLLPFAWMLSTSLKSNAQLFVWPPVWIPRPIVWQNYTQAVTVIPFFLYLKNTLVIALLNVVGVLFSCTLVAYGLARIQWPGRNFLFIIVLITMMMPAQVTMIPLFMIFRALGWVGTLKPLVVPAFFGVPFYIFLLRQFFMTIPFELSDAATIDGCSEFGIL